jgi:tetratricopeptide (TPR) repeat protein
LGESQALVGHLLSLGQVSQGSAVPEVEQLCQWVLDQAEGNPFYAEEIIRALIDDGAIVPDESIGGWSATRDIADLPIPDSLRGVLTARIDGLPEYAKRVLQVAAVVGRIFPYRVLLAVTTIETAPLRDQQLDQSLITLQREGMIRERTRIPEPEYIFKHELTQEAAYISLLKRERRVLHRQVAQTLERLFSDRIEEQVELLAHHWDQAGQVGRAISYLLRAGDRARRVGAGLEAIGFYRSALQKAPETAAELQRIHECLADVYLINLSRHKEALKHYSAFLGLAQSGEDRARGERKIAGVYQMSGDLAEARQHYQAALERLNSCPHSIEASRIHFGLSSLLISSDQLDEAARHASTSLAIARQLGDRRGLADANKALGVIAVQRGDVGAACQYDSRSLELYRELGDLPRTSQACNNLGDTYRLLGQMNRALESLGAGLEIAQRIGDKRDEALLLTTIAQVHLDRGEWETALANLEEALPLTQQIGVVTGLIEVHWVMGEAYQGARRIAAARHHLQKAEELSLESHHRQFLPQIHLSWASLALLQGELEEVRSRLSMALDAAGTQPSDGFLGCLHRCHGQLQCRYGDFDRAASHLARSLEYFDRAGLLVEAGKTHLSLGTARAGRGEEDDRGRACEHWLAARSIFSQVGATGHLAQAEECLEQQGCAARNRVAGPE